MRERDSGVKPVSVTALVIICACLLAIARYGDCIGTPVLGEFRKVDAKLLEQNQRRIEALLETGKVQKRDRDTRPTAGTVLTREYRDVEYCVVATTDGQYEFNGRMYPSLSMIAREIAGTRWSGPLFFERYGVSFVSVTQQFNTTTSMGRLMLNILLSFAQFEREVTGERIRDKIAASKAKGMWMGGVPPLGYDVDKRRLVPNLQEAQLIRHIFQRFIDLGSSTSLFNELKLDGVTSKAWTTQDGKVREGRAIDKGMIYKLLNNRTYLGELRHKEQWFPGAHPPIIERELWDRVHTILATNCRVRGGATQAVVPFLLKGIVFGNDGRALSPWHSTKKSNGRRYRYYIPMRDTKEQAGASGLPRLPAAELESAVLEQLRGILRAPALLGEVLSQAVRLDPTLDEAKVTVAMTRLDAIWDQLFPAEQTRIVRLLVEQVIVSPTDLELRLRANGIEQVVLDLRPESADRRQEAMA
jgi:site-specific DNA recombinase